MKHLLTILALAASSCGPLTEPEEHSEDQITIDILTKAQDERIAEGKTYRDKNGWIAATDCDGMIWSAKFGSFVDGFKPEAAEYPGEPGKFGRRPPPWCWTLELGDQGAKSQWSGDMAVAGLYPFAWLKKRPDIIDSHIQYGESNLIASMTWKMGEATKGYAWRATYKPGLVGLSYQLRWALGGPDDLRRKVTNPYASDLDDYRAHLQMMDIWLRGETNGGITQKMLERVREHAAREPHNPLYQYLDGLYSGDLGNAIELCKNADSTIGSYVRCHNPRSCEVAERVFACGLVLRSLTKERSPHELLQRASAELRSQISG